MKKTLLAGLLSGALLLSACSMGATEGGTSGGEADGKLKVGVILKTLSSEYWSYVAAGVKAAEKDLGVEVALQGPASETAYDEQNSMIETMLADNSIKALVISPLQPDSVVSMLGDTDKPILFVDTDAPYDKKVSYIGTGNETAAKTGGEYAAEVAGDGAEAVWIGGVKGNTTSDDREAGFTAGLEGGGVKVTVQQYAEGLGDKAASVMENVLTSSPNVSVVVANNDDMAAGAARSVKAAGKDMIIVGFDGIKAGVQNVIDGTVTATVAQDPFGMGYKAVEAAVKTAKGESVEDFIDTGSTVITKDNAEDYLAKLEEQLAGA
ncbi:sugar ABC transporter substrate-binding protein [Tessaracoccus sp. HDW20]|uniref:sugar ABC transporter substrate-binding protein n=1 Tax=Tessaracoccus coleopterorum TaxID=2714950 RepID=UPI0018D42B99|nr:sugar ABC transporter substrate-binding protein [Tessaracoccus coleopterorum]NHB85018.1 sugar ABC transporter substrate-binding protein [Tessaracoccus coleopterorum]